MLSWKIASVIKSSDSAPEEKIIDRTAAAAAQKAQTATMKTIREGEELDRSLKDKLSANGKRYFCKIFEPMWSKKLVQATKTGSSFQQRSSKQSFLSSKNAKQSLSFLDQGRRGIIARPEFCDQVSQPAGFDWAAIFSPIRDCCNIVVTGVIGSNSSVLELPNPNNAALEGIASGAAPNPPENSSVSTAVTSRFATFSPATQGLVAALLIMMIAVPGLRAFARARR